VYIITHKYAEEHFMQKYKSVLQIKSIES